MSAFLDQFKLKIDPVLPPEILAKGKSKQSTPRMKGRHIEKRFQLCFTADDMKAFAEVEKWAQEVAGVSATSVIKVAIRRYADHLRKAGESAGDTAEVIRELRQVTGN